MPTIPNYPASLMDQHSNWHMHPGHPELGGRTFLMGAPGSGLEFFTFHRDFLLHFHTWYDAQPGNDQNAVAPWTVIPPELKVAAAGWSTTWAQHETRITTNTPPFATADELGIFIETGIHNNFLHNAAGTIYNEPLLFNPMTSPRSTHFYQLHGLISNWWNHWARLQKGLGKEIIDNKHHIKEVVKDKDISDKHLHKELVKELEKLPKEKDKDVFEGGGFGNPVDPMGVLHPLSQRVANLEQSMGQAFIRASERPDVGATATGPRQRNKRS